MVFTEYRDTQIWLKDLLAPEGMAGAQVQLLFGGMEQRRREQLRLAFRQPPDQNPVRILLATDAASEGIDLHEHCHRLVNYDIPFNPNKLEQRIGRIDRYGQRQTPEVRHFIGTGWESEAGQVQGRPGVPSQDRGEGRPDGIRCRAQGELNPHQLADRVYQRARNGRLPVDVVLATSMLQVGVDVSRFGLMVVTCQPKNTA